jgi:hypothetical protein
LIIGKKLSEKREVSWQEERNQIVVICAKTVEEAFEKVLNLQLRLE